MDKLKSKLIAVLFVAFLYPHPTLSRTVTFEQTFSDKPIPVPPATQGQMADAFIDVTDPILITDIDITLRLTHSNIGDLQIYLSSPSDSGLPVKRICLFSYNNIVISNTGTELMDVIFDDAAAQPVGELKGDITGRFKPKNGSSLSEFNNRSALGRWRLEISDIYYSDTGRLDYLALTITNPEPASILTVTVGAAILLHRRSRKKS